MADITKCATVTCPIRSKCYRATAPNSMRQSYADFNWEYTGNTDENEEREVACEHFWDNKNR